MSPNSNPIEREAADWAAKSEQGRMPDTERSRFEQWLSADQRHYGAYMKALAVQIHLSKIGRANPSLAPVSLAKQRHLSRRQIMMGAIAACLLLAITLASSVWPKNETGTYTTPLGGVKVVPLADGSVMTLNTGSSAQVGYGLLSRNITLSGGEALFDVAKNKLRPFWVSARGIRVRAVGTSFAVKNIPGYSLEVMVREGVVAIETADGTHTVKVVADTRAFIDENGSVRTESVSQSEVVNALAWRQGYIFLARRTLADAAAEFARYSPTKIVIQDPIVGREMISGLFKASDPAGFAKATAQALNLKVEQNYDTIQLSVAPNKADK